MSKKEISLMGRKRTRELDSSILGEKEKGKEKLEEKKEVLMAMKAEESPKEFSEFSKSPESPESSEFKDQKKPKESAPQSTPQSIPLGVAAVYEREVKAAVSSLIKIHYRLSEAGTLNRRAYSVEEQSRKLVQEIKKFLAERADFYASKGMDDEDNRQACQQYVNDIREGLKTAGIKINYLEVRPVERV